jgi:hypothetical protein
MKTIRLLPLVFIVSCSGLMVPQSDKITERFYPDPDISISTPAFSSEDKFSSHADVLEFMQNYEAPEGVAYNLDTIGYSQNDKPLVMAYLGNPAKESIRIWIMGGLHGDEPGGVEGIMYLMNRLKESKNVSLLQEAHIAFLPMANPDGCDALTRTAANGLDLNRDQTKLLAQETKFWKAAFNSFAPEVALDMHEYRAFRKDYLRMGTQGMAAYYDVCFLYSGNLNVSESLRNYTHDLFVSEAARELDAIGMSNHDYFTSDKDNGKLVINQGSIHARSSASHHALTNCISTLVEVRGVDVGRKSFKRRVLASSTVSLSYIKNAVANKHELRQKLKKAAKEDRKAVVKSMRKVSQQRVTLIDLANEDTASVVFTMRDALHSEATMERPRPSAYILRNANEEIVNKLNYLGITNEPAPENQKLKVQEYLVKDIQEEAFVWEGVERREVSTLLRPTEISSGKGDIIIPMNQKNADLILELLEPESLNGFVRFGLIESEKDQPLSIYRIMQ